MVEIWLGDEPYLIYCQVQKDASGIPFPEFNVVKGELTQETYESCFMEPFMADRKRLFLTAKSKNSLLERLVSEADSVPNDVSVILEDEFDKRTALYKQAVKRKAIRMFGRLNGRDFERFCLHHLQNAQITGETYRFLIGRMQYGVREDCDLYTVRNWLSALASGPQPIEPGVVSHVVPEYVPGEVFRLFSFLAGRDAEGYFKLLDRLNGEDPHSGIGTLSMLLRSFRIAYKVSLVGAEDAPEVLGLSPWQMKGLGGISRKSAEAAMHLLQDGVNLIKKGHSAVQVTQEVSCRLFPIMALSD